MTTIARTITGGVDTHLDVHVAAALDERGALLGTETFATTPRGYEALLAWLYVLTCPPSPARYPSTRDSIDSRGSPHTHG